MATRTATAGTSAPPASLVDVVPATALPLRLFVVLFLVTLTVYGTSPAVTNGDSFLVAPSAHSLVHSGDLTLDEYVGAATDGGIADVQGPDGVRVTAGLDLPRQLPPGTHVYDHFSWVTAVVVAPLVVAFEVPGALGVDRWDIDRLVATGDTGLVNLVGASVLTALAAVVLSGIAWHALRLPARQRRRVTFVVGIVAALGTPAWSTLSRALWNQTTTVVFLSVATLLALRLSQVADDRHPKTVHTLAAGTGAAAGLAYATRPTAIVAVVVLGVWFLVAHRSLLLRYVAGGAAIAVPWVGVNIATFGTVQPPYYSTDRVGLRPETLEAVAANFVSPNRGLFVFSSVALLSVVGAVLALRSRSRGPVVRSLAVTAIAVVAVHTFIVSSSGEDWWAGSSYGPRFMAELIPFLLLLAMPAVEALMQSPRRAVLVSATAVLCVASVLMHLPGGWSKPAHCWSLDPVRVNDDSGRVWHWHDMQSLRPVRVLLDGGSPRDAALRRCDDLLDRRSAPS